MMKKIATAALISALPICVYAAPSVTGKSGTVANGESITITGSGFGETGPTVVVFDDFDDIADTGTAVDLSATVGAWDTRGAVPPVYHATSRSGTRSARITNSNGTQYIHSSLQKAFADAQEYFLAYATQVPASTYFPHTGKGGTHTGSDNASMLTDSAQSLYSTMFVGAKITNITDGSSCTITAHTATTVTCTLSGGAENDWDNGDAYKIRIFPATWPNESVAKLTWIMDGPTGGSIADDDKCLPTHISKGFIRDDGNALNAANGAASAIVYRQSAGDAWWQWGAWNRYASWSRADSANPATANGINWAQGIGEGVEQHTAIDTTHPVFANGTSPFRWNYYYVGAWIRPTELDTPVSILIDDLYLATGANAAARVEIGNASTYSACTKLAIATPTSWADTSVTATVREGSFDNGDSVYLYVIDKDNAPSAGYGPITMGSGSGSGLRRLGIRVSE